MVHELNGVFKFLTTSIEPAFNFKVINRPLDFLHNEFLESKIFHALLEANDLSICLDNSKLTKSYINS